MKKTYEPKEGQYYYRPKGRQWAIYQRHYTGEGTCLDDKIEEVGSRKKAIELVYKPNKW